MVKDSRNPHFHSGNLIFIQMLPQMPPIVKIVVSHLGWLQGHASRGESRGSETTPETVLHEGPRSNTKDSLPPSTQRGVAATKTDSHHGDSEDTEKSETAAKFDFQPQRHQRKAQIHNAVIPVISMSKRRLQDFGLKRVRNKIATRFHHFEIE